LGETTEKISPEPSLAGVEFAVAKSPRDLQERVDVCGVGVWVTIPYPGRVGSRVGLKPTRFNFLIQRNGDLLFKETGTRTFSIRNDQDQNQQTTNPRRLQGAPKMSKGHSSHGPGERGARANRERRTGVTMQTTWQSFMIVRRKVMRRVGSLTPLQSRAVRLEMSATAMHLEYR
jgi:hypothetical protein